VVVRAGGGLGQDGAVLSVFAFDASGPRVVEDPEQISDLLQRPDTLVWADVLHASPDELALVEVEFSLHPLAMEDARKHGQRPKLEIYENHGFLVAYASTAVDRKLNEVDIFVGVNWMVTIHENNPSGAHFDITAVRERCLRHTNDRITVAFLLYTVLDEIVDTYFGAVETIGDQIDTIEERIFSDEDPVRDERPMQREMLEVRKGLLSFRRKVEPLREVLLALLRDDLPFLDPDAHHYLRDILDHVMRITDEIDNRRELIGNAVDAHLAMVGNQMNQIMKKMTSWGAILIVSTLITGIYGMNFKQMDLVDWEFGFRFALLTILAVTVGLYAYFKRKGWI
jgi:magnesium transporter